MPTWEYPQIYSGYWSEPASGSTRRPSGTPGSGGLPAGPDVGLGDIPLFNAYNIGAQGAALAGRIPQGPALESASSEAIAGLLNPPSLFPDTSRQAAEVSAGRGIAGSPAAASTAVRMTDEERLRRMALGQQFLSAASARNPAAPLVDPTQFAITPIQRAQMDLQRFVAQLTATRGMGGGGGFRGGGGGGGFNLDLPEAPFDFGDDYGGNLFGGDVFGGGGGWDGGGFGPLDSFGGGGFDDSYFGGSGLDVPGPPPLSGLPGLPDLPDYWE